MRLVIISDSAFKRQDDTGLACRGHFIVLCGDHAPEKLGGLCHIIDFASKRQRRVTRSTYAAELNGLIDSLEIGKVIALTVHEVVSGCVSPTNAARIEEKGESRWHQIHGLVFFSVFWQTVSRIRMFISLKPFVSQEESSLKISFH